MTQHDAAPGSRQVMRITLTVTPSGEIQEFLEEFSDCLFNQLSKFSVSPAIGNRSSIGEEKHVFNVAFCSGARWRDFHVKMPEGVDVLH